MNTTDLPIRRLKHLLSSKLLSAEDLISAFYDKIEEKESRIKAFLSLKPRRQVVSEARLLDNSRVKGLPLPPLAGIPIGVKDNISIAGMPLTCGSRILRGFLSPYDATVIMLARQAGMLFIGKTNMDEFGMGSSTEKSAFFATANPHNIEYVPGGTSGGSAAAVAAREVPVALGSDTGGSVRQPASLCGVVGLKPSYGRVSRYGLVAYGSSLDQVGILATDVLDSALLLSVVAGFDSRDPTSVRAGVDDYCKTAKLRMRCPFRIGIPIEYVDEGVDSEVRNCLQHCSNLLASDRCAIVDVSLPHTKYALSSYYIITSCEASSNLARYAGIMYGFRAAKGRASFSESVTETRHQGFGAEVQRRIMLGTFALSYGHKGQYYDVAVAARRAIASDFTEVFKDCDAILHPVSPTPAWRLGDKTEDPLKMYLSDTLSVPASLAGLPAIVVPCGFSSGNLPIGLQITSPCLQEGLMLAIALRLETLLLGRPFRA